MGEEQEEELKGEDSEMPYPLNDDGDQLSLLDEEALLTAPLKVGHLLQRPDETR